MLVSGLPSVIHIPGEHVDEGPVDEGCVIFFLEGV